MPDIVIKNQIVLPIMPEEKESSRPLWADSVQMFCTFLIAISAGAGGASWWWFDSAFLGSMVFALFAIFSAILGWRKEKTQRELKDEIGRTMEEQFSHHPKFSSLDEIKTLETGWIKEISNSRLSLLKRDTLKGNLTDLAQQYKSQFNEEKETHDKQKAEDMKRLERQARANESEIINDLEDRLEEKFESQWLEFEKQYSKSSEDKINLESKILINSQNEDVVNQFETEFPNAPNHSGLHMRIKLKIEKLSLQSFKNLKVENSSTRSFLEQDMFDRCVEGIVEAAGGYIVDIDYAVTEALTGRCFWVEVYRLDNEFSDEILSGFLEEKFEPWDANVIKVMKSDYYRYFFIDSPFLDEYQESKIQRDTE